MKGGTLSSLRALFKLPLSHETSIMTLLPVLIGGGGLVLCGIAFHLGYFDRPQFEKRETFNPLGSKEETFLLWEAAPTKNFGKEIPRILTHIKRCLLASEPAEGTGLMARAASKYGAPQGAEMLTVALYMEDPAPLEKPRWGFGIAVDVPNFQAAQALAANANKEQSQGNDSGVIRAVRVGGPVISGRIPWRNMMLTPMLQASRHWNAIFDVYTRGGYNICGRTKEEGPIGAEVYVTGPNMRAVAMDYVILMGDIKSTWQDTYPN